MENRTHGLALSGGGTRAAAFHAGLFQYLAERDQLKKIGHISTVSGGSLFTGLVFSIAGNQWPSSTEYLEKVHPRIRQLLTETSIQSQAICDLLFNPFNWRYVLSRANIIAQVLEESWSIQGCLGDLPKYPVWSVNATTAENGRRFRFKGTQIGDYESGYANASDTKIATAMAVSAAFPGGIGPLSLISKNYCWEKRPWGSPDMPVEIKPEFHRFHLYDGGVYDNLGLEPLFDSGTQQLKSEPPVTHLIVSDAGATLQRQAIPSALNPRRFKRIADMAFDQVQSLRVRSLMNFARQNPGHAFYIRIGTVPATSRNCSGSKLNDLAPGDSWLTSEQILKSATYPTTLRKMSENDFHRISRHGYETGKWSDLRLGMTH